LPVDQPLFVVPVPHRVGIIGVFPLYTLHTLVLGWVIFQRKRVTLNSMFLAGMIFGLYESCITKVLWVPTWGNTQWIAGGWQVAPAC
jgi:hypothetical protein